MKCIISLIITEHQPQLETEVQAGTPPLRRAQRRGDLRLRLHHQAAGHQVWQGGPRCQPLGRPEERAARHGDDGGEPPSMVNVLNIFL